MITFIGILERGPTPGILRREFNGASKEAWAEAAAAHHAEHTHLRFTEEHARAAGYTRRKGQNLPRDSRAFKRSYYGRKLRSATKGGGPNRADPLVYTGFSQQRSRFPRVSSTGRGARLAFDVPAFNRRHPKSQVRASEEFRRTLPREEQRISEVYDSGLDRRLAAISATKTTRLTA